MSDRLRAAFAAVTVLVLTVALCVVADPAMASPMRPSCTRTSSGSCIRGGEYCPQADYGMTGTNASGDVYICTGDRTHPRWEPTGGSGSGGDPTPPPTASGTCRYSPALPKRVIVNHAKVTLRTVLRFGGTAGAACTRNFLVSADLVRGDDSYSMSWSDDAKTDTQTVYPFEIHPGTYKLTSPDCDAWTTDFSQSYSCSVTAGSTVIKFAGHARLSAKRLTGANRSKVRFTAVATRANADYGTSPVTTTASLQMYVGHGHWRTIHTATARGSHGWVFTYRRAPKATYRLVTAETAASFAGRSATVRK